VDRHIFQACPVWISGYTLRVTSQAWFHKCWLGTCIYRSNEIKLRLSYTASQSGNYCMGEV
jgi:hypothetical protein